MSDTRFSAALIGISLLIFIFFSRTLVRLECLTR